MACGNSVACVGIERLDNGMFAVFDTKHSEGPRLVFDRDEIGAFLDPSAAQSIELFLNDSDVFSRIVFAPGRQILSK